MVKLWVIINSLLYFGIGAATIVNPSGVANTISFVLTTPGATAEFKAMYGGLQIALAAIMMLLYKEQQFHYAMAFLAIIYLGFGSGRLVGIIGNGAYDRTTMTYFAIEFFSVCFSSYLFFRKT
jgi:hypothetical protein